METLTLTLDLAALLALLFFSVRNERRPDGTPEQGPFAIEADPSSAKPPSKDVARQTARQKPAPATRARRRPSPR